jgi:hypothetical protein
MLGGCPGPDRKFGQLVISFGPGDVVNLTVHGCLEAAACPNPLSAPVFAYFYISSGEGVKSFPALQISCHELWFRVSFRGVEPGLPPIGAAGA